MYSPQESAQIQMFRQKTNNGTITKEELKEALALLARGRTSAASSSAATKTARAAKAKPDGDALLGELEGL
jgi:hypothetical protein